MKWWSKKLIRIRYLFLFICSQACENPTPPDLTYSSQTLKIEKIKPSVWLHISYIKLSNGINFPCNGLIYVQDDEAIVLDTTIDEGSSAEMLEFVESQGIDIKGVIVNHFHNDCLGGLQEFHKRQIPSYALNKTIELAANPVFANTSIGFDKSLELTLGDSKIISFYPGAGHTIDNIVTYLPDVKVLFGGCLIKALDAGQGNLADADTANWSKAVENVKKQFPEAETIVPGHGKYGDQSLLDNTISMFIFNTQQ
jgi:metallo-beta-lactamase class B